MDKSSIRRARLNLYFTQSLTLSLFSNGHLYFYFFHQALHLQLCQATSLGICCWQVTNLKYGNGSSTEVAVLSGPI